MKFKDLVNEELGKSQLNESTNTPAYKDILNALKSGSPACSVSKVGKVFDFDEDGESKDPRLERQFWNELSEHLVNLKELSSYLYQIVSKIDTDSTVYMNNDVNKIQKILLDVKNSLSKSDYIDNAKKISF